MSEIILKSATPKTRVKPETALRSAIAQYLTLQYPKLIWFFDLAGEHKLSKATAKRQSQLRNTRYALPDLHILEPRGGFHGLFVELKAKGARVFKRDGTPADAHVLKQSLCIDRMRELGYSATFAQGLSETKAIIDNYLKA